MSDFNYPATRTERFPWFPATSSFLFKNYTIRQSSFPNARDELPLSNTFISKAPPAAEAAAGATQDLGGFMKSSVSSALRMLIKLTQHSQNGFLIWTTDPCGPARLIKQSTFLCTPQTMAETRTRWIIFVQLLYRSDRYGLLNT